MKSLICTGGIALMFAFASMTAAEAQKKMSYDKAFAECKMQVDRTVAADQPSARGTAGAACMKTHGYRLKKKSKI